MTPPRVLIIDDEQNFRDFLAEALEAHEYTVDTAGNARSGLSLARDTPPDIVLLDQNLPDRSGLDILTELRRLPGSPTVVVMTAYAATPSAVSAIKSGAYQYLTKPFDFGDLLELLAETGCVESAPDERDAAALGRLIGRSGAMVELRRQVERVARSHVGTVLVQGESGTGKELVARAIHALSDRASGPLVTVNCGALTDTLLMSELFGHERGAFTDARERRKGVFEAAQGGTLFLDEIGEMGPRAQSALLRVLEQRCITRVGGTEEIAVDVRVIAATNRSLRDQVAEGSFREDLLFRLNVVQLTAPPLRERGADVMRLARRFSSTIAARYQEQPRRFAPETRDLIHAYAWPGNVRELRNAVERAYVVGRGPEIQPSDLPIGMRGGQREPSPAAPLAAPAVPHLAAGAEPLGFSEAKQHVIDRFEASYLQALLARHDGNVTHAAEEAGLLRQALQRLLKRHGIDRNDYCEEAAARRAAS